MIREQLNQWVKSQTYFSLTKHFSLTFCSAQNPKMYPQNYLLGVLLIIVSEFMFVSMSAVVKVTAQHAPSEAIVFFRNFFAMMILLPWMLHRGMDVLNWQQVRLHFLRSISGLGAMYCFFYTIAHIPLAEASLLKLTMPFFLPVLSIFWLAEAVSLRVIWAIIIGFIGVAIILKPGTITFSSVSLIALLGGLLAAIATSTIRRMSAVDSSLNIVFYFSVIGSVFSAIPLFWSGFMLTYPAFILLFTIAIFATIAQLVMTYAYQIAPAARIGPFSYVSVIFATSFGWWFWREQVDYWFFMGASLIIFAGILLILDDKKSVLAESLSSD
jgi:drug/metabolite transporter (DMT)-like permease